jgi:hypothetical protein
MDTREPKKWVASGERIFGPVIQNVRRRGASVGESGQA